MHARKLTEKEAGAPAGFVAGGDGITLADVTLCEGWYPAANCLVCNGGRLRLTSRQLFAWLQMRPAPPPTRFCTLASGARTSTCEGS